jgi:hypothetical protein
MSAAVPLVRVNFTVTMGGLPAKVLSQSKLQPERVKLLAVRQALLEAILADPTAEGQLTAELQAKVVVPPSGLVIDIELMPLAQEEITPVALRKSLLIICMA